MPDTATHVDDDTVEFFFDPACPWTWITSRWIVDVAEQTGIDVQWHALSLALLNGGELEPNDKIADSLHGPLTQSLKVLRIIEHLASHGRNDDAGRLYTAIHVQQEEADEALLIKALRTTGLEDLRSIGDDAALDDAVTASHERARSLVAGDTGSPVISLDGAAIFGPIVSPAPRGAEALELWRSVRSVLMMPAFFEVKRHRSAPPQMDG